MSWWMQTEVSKSQREPATRSVVVNCCNIMYNVIKETSQLAGKAYEDSDYTIVIAAVH